MFSLEFWVEKFYPLSVTGKPGCFRVQAGKRVYTIRPLSDERCNLSYSSNGEFYSIITSFKTAENIISGSRMTPSAITSVITSNAGYEVVESYIKREVVALFMENGVIKYPFSDTRFVDARARAMALLSKRTLGNKELISFMQGAPSNSYFLPFSDAYALVSKWVSQATDTAIDKKPVPLLEDKKEVPCMLPAPAAKSAKRIAFEEISGAIASHSLRNKLSVAQAFPDISIECVDTSNTTSGKTTVDIRCGENEVIVSSTGRVIQTSTFKNFPTGLRNIPAVTNLILKLLGFKTKKKETSFTTTCTSTSTGNYRGGYSGTHYNGYSYSNADKDIAKDFGSYAPVFKQTHWSAYKISGKDTYRLHLSGIELSVGCIQRIIDLVEEDAITRGVIGDPEKITVPDDNTVPEFTPPTVMVTSIATEFEKEDDGLLPF